jgi:hypothetical protein
LRGITEREMIEELKLLQEIVGDLSAIGGWVAGGYILYKIVTSLVLMIGGGWLINLVVGKISEHMKAGISKAEAERIQCARTRENAEHSANEIRLKAEIENVKHMYKILKEKKETEEHEPESV